MSAVNHAHGRRARPLMTLSLRCRRGDYAYGVPEMLTNGNLQKA